MEGVADAAEEVPVVDWATTLSATARRARAVRMNIVNGGGEWERRRGRERKRRKGSALVSRSSGGLDFIAKTKFYPFEARPSALSVRSAGLLSILGTRRP